MSPDPARRVLHIDMDAFYASVEQRDDPALRNRPVAVGGAGQGSACEAGGKAGAGGTRERGVVAAASYEARRFGVRSAMPSATARRLCPDLVFVPARFDAYREASARIRAVFARYTPLIQPLSLDEAYLDVTRPLIDLGSATAIARAIKAEIRAETGLAASAGVSCNKLLAKLASDHRKPDGLFVVTPAMAEDFVAPLPVGRFHGIGPVTAARMNAMGIHTGLDLRGRSLEFLIAEFGRIGPYYHGIARGLDDRKVEPDRVRKSVGVETTFARDLTAWDQVAPAIRPLLDKLRHACRGHGCAGRTLTVKVKHADFRQITRARSFAEPIAEPALEAVALGLLRPCFPLTRPVRLLGVALSGLEPLGAERPGRQLALPLPLLSPPGGTSG